MIVQLLSLLTANQQTVSRQCRKCRFSASKRLMHCSKLLLYSITSSARSRIDVGTSSLSALVVLRLKTNSNRVDCASGKSARLSPFRIRPFQSATRTPYGSNSRHS
jgi:hypothetical protein